MDLDRDKLMRYDRVLHTDKVDYTVTHVSYVTGQGIRAWSFTFDQRAVKMDGHAPLVCTLILEREAVLSLYPPLRISYETMFALTQRMNAVAQDVSTTMYDVCEGSLRQIKGFVRGRDEFPVRLPPAPVWWREEPIDLWGGDDDSDDEKREDDDAD